MNIRARLAVLGCAVAALAACDHGAIERRVDNMSRFYSQSVLGEEYDASLVPAGADGFGPLVVTRSRLTFENGSQIPLRQVTAGIYHTPSLRSWHGAQGSPICGGQPVTFLALHRGPGDLYYLNAGDWPTAPSVPGREAGSIPGACQTTTYTLGAAG